MYDFVRASFGGVRELLSVCVQRKGTILGAVFAHMFSCALLGIIASIITWQWQTAIYGRDLHTMISLGVGFLLVFRSSIAYNRFWEGRGHVGGTLESVKTLAILMDATTPNEGLGQPTKIYLRNLLVAYLSYSVVVLGKGSDFKKGLPKKVKATMALFPQETVDRMNKCPKTSHPLFIVEEIMRAMNAACKAGIIEKGHLKLMLKRSQSLVTSFNAACKISNTPIPFPYQQMCAWLVLLYVYGSPFALAGAFLEPAAGSASKHMALTTISSVLLAMAYFGIYCTSTELEDPFGDDANDLPLLKYRDTIQKEVDNLVTIHDTTENLLDMLENAGVTKEKHFLSAREGGPGCELVKAHPEYMDRKLTRANKSGTTSRSRKNNLFA